LWDGVLLLLILLLGAKQEAKLSAAMNSSNFINKTVAITI